jgi:hypothetical protein
VTEQNGIFPGICNKQEILPVVISPLWGEGALKYRRLKIRIA